MAWVPHDVRDEVVDFVRRWSEKTEIVVGRYCAHNDALLIRWPNQTISHCRVLEKLGSGEMGVSFRRIAIRELSILNLWFADNAESHSLPSRPRPPCVKTAI
jgi:hypothetical protein